MPRFWRNRRARRLAYQVAFLGAAVMLAALLARATAENLARRRIGMGFAFLGREAGFSLGEVMPLPVLDARSALFALAVVGTAAAGALLRRLAGARGAGTWLALAAATGLAALAAGRAIGPELVTFAADRSFLLAIASGVANAIKVAALGIVLASAVGFVVGVARLSGNPLVRGSATVYVELFRNVPLLIQIFFWYFAVLRALPGVRQSIDVLGIAAINNRGIFLPRLIPGEGAGTVVAVVLLATALAGLAWRPLSRRLPLALAVPLLVAAVAAAGAAAFWLLPGAFALEVPRLVGFNFGGGSVVSPEFGALLLGLTLYTGAYIAEIVRSGLAGVGQGQRDAARALGLGRTHTMRFVVVPQALRIAIPPLITQYLSLTKDSSLGIAIGYPEIVSVTGQVINQTGQAIEMLAVALLIYMSLSLAVSAILNWHDARTRWRPL